MSHEHTDSYVSPLATRNASPQMQCIWSAQRKHATWRRLWLALAEAEKDLGLPITDEQISDLKTHLDDIDFDKAAEYERQFRHDVMAHIHTFGDAAPKARAIIHLGATSQFVNCNTEIIQIRDSLRLTAGKCARVIDALAEKAVSYRALPTLGFTHYQPAQPTTVGKRAAMWAADLAIVLEDIEYLLTNGIRLRGAKGATGTQASYLDLFDNDEDKVEQLDRLVVERMGFDPDTQRLLITGQTYPRVFDARVLNVLATVAAVIHRICNDIRLLSNRKEVEEPFESSQIGSSAMPYKRNPMRCERATGLSRFVMSLPPNALNTTATQWLERTLDDSSNRRIVLPEAFLALDGALDIMHNVSAGLIVNEKMVEANLLAELPFMATENILMEAVRQGADRQQVHEAIRRHSHEAGRAVKQEGKANDLIDRLRGEPLLAGVDLDRVMEPARYIGLAARQADRFIVDTVDPIRKQYASWLSDEAPTLKV
ncbi:MAG: adenylosuccinate lyase [Planctomycetes bacterium]|nr:adenylosuccinate lyase [Planctomycetota bacterium]NOG53976.1 adenylosuccinate lyase [Planctomycetota bacterium]